MRPRNDALIVFVIASAILGATGCPSEEAEWQWDLPTGFPLPRVPADNPMSQAKVDLGRFLFYDTKLSDNQTESCATCHQQEFAFTDGMSNAMGSTGMMHPRSSMAPVERRVSSDATWANPVVFTLEAQALLPMFGDSPIIELGLGGKEDELLDALRADADYPVRFAEAFPDDPDRSPWPTPCARSRSFERTFVTRRLSLRPLGGDGEVAAMSESALRGMSLFFSERFECFHCHGGFNFSARADHAGVVFDEAVFFNNGLYNVDGRGAYPPDNKGLFEFTGDADDKGRFKPPTLRNIELTRALHARRQHRDARRGARHVRRRRPQHDDRPVPRRRALEPVQEHLRPRLHHVGPGQGRHDRVPPEPD